MKKQTKLQVELLKKYGVKDYTIEGDKITINGYIDFSSLTSADKDFLKGTTINGYLDLRSLTSADKDFLKGTTINGSLDLRSLTSADKDFLKGTTINGYLYLRSLTSADKDFLKGTTINGYIDFSSLTSADKAILNKNVSQLKQGYNEQGGYCYFDGILTKVLAYSKKKGYGIYATPIGYIAQKDKYTAHANDIKKAIIDVEFKIVAERIKNEPIKEDTLLTVKYYRTVTGACDSGCRQFMQANGLEYDVVGNETVERNPIKARDLLPILEKNRAYGYDKIKSLITF
jgi:hypothetical protein